MSSPVNNDETILRNQPCALGQPADLVNNEPTKRKRTRSERGYIMTMMVIMLPVLLSFMALAVDATYYWFRGVQIQRAVDAAALAGVTRMPKYNEAVNAGNEIAKRNGFVDGEDDMVVTPSRIPKNNKRFKMTITDNSVGMFFGRVLSNGWSITRTSTAEYISNIPLGSKENAIGTGYLSDSGPDLQNFWLAVSGPCAPKEWGDQFLSRWDGNGVNKFDSSVTQANPAPVNPAITATNASRQFSALCDVDPNPVAAANQTGVGYLRTKMTAKNAMDPLLPKLFPAVVQNLDYNAGKSGYDYIIDVPCYSATGTPVPPPCDGTNMPGDLMIQVYDPVFNPDSIQRFAQRVNPMPAPAPARSDASGFTNEVDDRLKPDKYGLYRPEVTECYSIPGSPPTPSAGCALPDTGAENPKASDVRVTTDVRIYPPDNSPLDYSDDVAMDLTGATVTNTVDTPDKFVLDSEATLSTKKVRRFGSCMKWTDEWTSSVPGATAGSHYFYSVPPASVGTPYGTSEETTWNQSVEPTKSGLSVPTECAKYMSQWVTIKRISSTNRRGRYRLNLRTIDAVNSFGSNGFAIRAYFVVPGNSDETYPACLKAGQPPGNVCTSPTQEASVAGDSTMSVFASVNSVSSFYLAQLSPAKLFRNKVVVVSLWDPGEGAAKLQILRPEYSSSICDSTLVDSAVYCIQPFQWTVGRPGIATFNTTDPFAGLSSGTDYQDVCIDKGRPTGSEALPTSLAVSHPSNVADGTIIDGCKTSSGSDKVQPDEIKRSRQFKEDKAEQKFNDRLVTVAIKVPENYGCQPPTGTIDPVSGNPITCIDMEDLGNDLPEGGWWKIKYTPRLNVDPVSGLEVPGSYKKITDRTTWSVGLRGDPVHLVPDGG
jgi:Putative Flp pilus-assembly TadE/G-like